MSVVPELAVRRGREAIAFYERAFGAVVVYRVGGTDDHPDVVAQLTVGDSSFWVSDEAPSSANFSPESLGGSTVRILLVVDDPAAVVERAQYEGAIEVYPVAEAARLAARPDRGSVRPPLGDRQATGGVAARRTGGRTSTARRLIPNSGAFGDGPDQAGRTTRAQDIAVPTFQPERGEMRRVWATSRACPSWESIV